MSAEAAFVGYGTTTDLGHNWHLQFFDADGIPLNMLSFDVIDFGAIAYKEIFQNTKTILATPMFSAALERLLGVEQRIIDLPIQQAAEATVSVLQALYFWEPRVVPKSIEFNASDALNGHLTCNLQLKVRNHIYGTHIPYDRANAFAEPTPVTQQLPPMGQPIVIQGPQGPQGATGPQGERGSLWFAGTGGPSGISDAKEQDMYLDTLTGDVHQMQDTSTQQQSTPPPQGPPGTTGRQGATGRRGSMWFFGTTDPSNIPNAQSYDLYLNTQSGDVWQMSGSTWRKVTNAHRVE
jgi:phage baseplate assembly protein W